MLRKLPLCLLPFVLSACVENPLDSYSAPLNDTYSQNGVAPLGQCNSSGTAVFKLYMQNLGNLLPGQASGKFQDKGKEIRERGASVATFVENWNGMAYKVLDAANSPSSLFKYFYANTMGSGLSTGLMMISTWPMTATKSGLYNTADALPAESFAATKGWEAAQVVVPNGPRIGILNTHMQAPFNCDSAFVRQRQSSVVKDAVLSQFGQPNSGIPVIMAGDWNFQHEVRAGATNEVLNCYKGKPISDFGTVNGKKMGYQTLLETGVKTPYEALGESNPDYMLQFYRSGQGICNGKTVNITLTPLKIEQYNTSGFDHPAEMISYQISWRSE